jgi:hypothetical protein
MQDVVVQRRPREIQSLPRPIQIVAQRQELGSRTPANSFA